MKKLAIALLFALVITVLAEQDPDLVAFAKFMRKYNKIYTDAAEFQQRFINYKASVVRAAEKTKKSPKATYGVTKFSDMTPEEFRSTVLMRKPIVPDNKPKTNALKPKPLPYVPETYDWRDHGAVTAVKDQGQCGSCWAFSVTENIESMWILAGKANNSINLAPQQIVDCDTSDDGCEGGDPPTAYEYVISAGGMEPNADYPYTAEDGNCNFQKQDVVAKISNWQYATELYSEEEIQANLLSWGPLSICVDAEAWQDYEGGVMTWEECAWINLLDHCVDLVGYNATDSSNPYWIVRNSWNTNWGVEGYIYLEMWEDTCGMAHEATSSIV